MSICSTTSKILCQAVRASHVAFVVQNGGNDKWYQHYCRAYYKQNYHSEPSSSHAHIPSHNSPATTQAVPNVSSSGIRRPLLAGQPTPTSHPHLLATDEVTVGITRDEYRQRRARLIEALSCSEGRHHALLLAATPRHYMVDKIPYFYRQDTDFLWVSGCLEADCLLVLHTLPGGSSVGSARPHHAVMFCPLHSPSQQLWDGPRTTHHNGVQVWGVDEALPMTELIPYLTRLEESLASPTLWYQQRGPPHPACHRVLSTWLGAEGRAGGIESPKTQLHNLRLLKSPAEQRLMRETCRISAEAMAATMAWSRPGFSEHEVFARVDYESRMRGACHLAYPPVVAGGDRANIIHYITNNQIINDGDMVLVDAGSEYHGYSGDVSRTWPINGKFSPAQRELYEVVLQVQSEVIALVRDRRLSLDQLYRAMCTSLGNALVDLGVFPRTYSAEHRSRAAMALCPHHVGHYLGMDVHDTPSASRTAPLLPGMIITVEPGVYVPLGCRLAPARYHGLGIRVEDDVLVTATGCEVLTDACPRHPDAVEACVRGPP